MFKYLIRLILVVAILIPIGQNAKVQAQSQDVQYISPLPGSRYNPPGSTIAIRYGDSINPQSIHSQFFSVRGSQSGIHNGETVLADDQKTIIFKPDLPFALGESVSVDLNPGISSAAGITYSGISFSFSITRLDPAAPQALAAVDSALKDEFGAPATQPINANIPSSQYVTAPSDFPVIHVTTPAATGVADGYVFVSNFGPFAYGGGLNPGSYILMLDNNGEPVYYQKIPETAYVTDFKKLSNGLLAYWEGGVYHLLNNNYVEVRTIRAGNGYPVLDGHELLFLPNGHYMFMIYGAHPMDMSAAVPGGNPNAIVIECVLQEVDSQDNVVFQWSSLDYISVLDSNQDLTKAMIDYIHSNAIDIDSQGNILLSSRHLDEITKINRLTGDIIWRLGGKGNQFTYATAPGITESPYFWLQHDVRYMPNGDITLFDNHAAHDDSITRILEFSLDETNKIATLVWFYRNSPDVKSGFMGNAQRLPNGNTMVGWGGSTNPNITEAKSDGTKLFEMGFDSPYVNYRAFRFTWHGYPTWVPSLALAAGNSEVTLTFSWNGATDIAKYLVYGGNTLSTMTVLEEMQKSGFETSTTLSGSQAGLCYYQVLPIDVEGKTTVFSYVVHNPVCPRVFLPIASNPGQ